jgi:uncharacterized protein DUF3237
MSIKTASMCTLVAGILALIAGAGQSAAPQPTPIATHASSGDIRPAKPQSRRGPMKELKSAHLFTIAIKLHPPIQMGDTPAGKRRVFVVSGGEFAGDRIRGTIMPVIGSDLLLVRADGSAQQDVRMLLKTDDGDLVLMTYRGVRHASDDVNARIARGEHVSGSDYYLRTAPFFETSSAKYSWINKIVAVGVGERREDSVVYEIFEIL